MTTKYIIALLALSTAAIADDKVPTELGKTVEQKEPALKTEALTQKTNEQKSSVQFSKEQIDEIKRIVAETISDSPEHVVKAIQNFGEQEQLKQTKAMDEAIAKNRDKLLAQAGAVSLGAKGSSTKLVVFLDPNCPHCRKYDKVLQEVEKEHGKFEIVYRLLPILGDKSVEATKVLIAAAVVDHGKFTKVLEKVATSQEALDKATTLQLAKDVGYDVKVLEEKMNGEEVKKALDTNAELAQEINLQGTPTSILAEKDSIKMITPSDKKSLEGYLTAAKTEGATKSA